MWKRSRWMLVVVVPGLLLGSILVPAKRSDAQITVRCYREYCVVDPTTRKKLCVVEEIDCPPT